MSNDRFYIRPENPEELLKDSKAMKDLVSAIVDWVMACKADFERRQKEKDETKKDS